MNLQTKNLFMGFTLTLSFTLIFPALFPSLRLSYFVPYLIILYYQKSFLACLWNSLLCGVIIDLLSAEPRMGISAVSFCITSAILYQQKRHFFADSLSTLPIMTYFFSVISTFFTAWLLYTLGRGIKLSWGLAYTDLIAMPLMDGIYAFIVFIAPFLFFAKRRKTVL